MKTAAAALTPPLVLALLAWTPAPLIAQTQVDLRSQSRSVDFSGAAATKPFKSGTTLPAACTVGEMFFKTDAAAGQNVYTCGSPNTWSATSTVSATNTGPGGAEVLKTQAGNIITGRQVLAGEGIVLSQQTDTVTAEVDTAVIPRYTVSSAAPTGACQDGRDLFHRTAGFPNLYTCLNSAWTPVWPVATSLPSTCYVGQLMFRSDLSAIFGCTATNTWTRLTNSGGVDLTVNGECIISTACAPVPMNNRAALQADATAGKFAAVRIVVRDQIKLGRGTIYASFGTTTGAFTAAIYDDNNGVPGNKISGSDLRFTNLASAGYRQVAWGSADVTLTPKIYWLGFSSEDASTQYLSPGGSFSSVGYLLSQLTTFPGSVKCSNAVTGTGETYELPTACGTATAWSAFAVDAPLIVASAR